MASSQNSESPPLGKHCRCGEKDSNIWNSAASDNNTDKESTACSNCQVLKSGPLFISSRGIGWTSWKKRWFILTRTSLVFFRSDPNAPLQKGAEPNLTLGGIDLSNSASVVMKADKKLLTVLFPDGRDGRAFTLKAETSEDLYEWKAALENALAQAPVAAQVMGQNGIFRNDLAEGSEFPVEQLKDKQTLKSLVVGRPILLALEDIDGSPSFLEKALRFIEEHGIKVEGILRQSADVEEVKQRVHEYEHGKTEFSSEEDAHVVGDCIKYVLRELPSSPVPASCCTALVEAYRTDRASRLNNIRATIAETFPEPNRRLLQRILKMMKTVAAHKQGNRMSLSALAACMAPLLLRPLLAGDCEIEDDFNMGGDGSIQLLQAAAAANHAQAIVIILLEEYEKFFEEGLLEHGSLSSEVYSESEVGDLEDEESILEDDDYQEDDIDLDADVEDDDEYSSSGTLDESERSCSEAGTYSSENKDFEDPDIDFNSSKAIKDSEAVPTASGTIDVAESGDTEQTNSPRTDMFLNQQDTADSNGILQGNHSSCLEDRAQASCELNEDHCSISMFNTSGQPDVPSDLLKTTEKSEEIISTGKRPTVWGRTPARKNLSMESIDYTSDDDDEIAIKRLEITKIDLHTNVIKEVKENSMLKQAIEKRKEALCEQRLMLEQEVQRLGEQLQKERELRTSLEAGLMNQLPGHLLATSALDSKTRANVEEITLAEADINSLKQTVADLQGKLNHTMLPNKVFLCESCKKQIPLKENWTKTNQQTIVDCASSLHDDKNMSKDMHNLPGNAFERTGTHLLKTEPSQEKQSYQKEKTEFLSGKTSSSSASSGSSTAPSTVDSNGSAKKLSNLEMGAFRRKFSSQNEYASSQEGRNQGAKIQTETPLSSPNESVQKQQTSITYQTSVENRNDAVHLEDPKTSGSQPTSRRTICKGENSIAGADSRNMRRLTKDFTSSPQKQPAKQPAKQLDASEASLSSSKTLGSSQSPLEYESASIGCDVASKRYVSRSENLKKEAEDLASNRQPHPKQQQNATNPKTSKSSYEQPADPSHDSAPRRTSSREEVSASSATALTRLSNRLNFLKERRVQLVSELQNLETNTTFSPNVTSSGAEGPLRTNSR